MNNLLLKQLLSEYSSKRNRELSEATKKKTDFYSKYPRLQEIDSELSSFALKTAKALLQTSDKNLLENFNLKKKALVKEKNEIYKSLNITSSFFDPHYDCKLCKDTGYITNNNSTEMCNCLKQKIFNIEYNNINNFDISKYELKNFSTEVYSSEINPDKYGSSVSPRDNIKIIKKIVNNFINNFDNPNEKNLLFFGNTGLGKTYLSNCIANEILHKNKTVLYQTAPIMLDSILEYRLRKV